MKTAADHIFRLDTFIVPGNVLDAFIERVRETHALLRGQPGFVQDFILEQPDTDGTVRLVTLAEWEDEYFVAQAREAVLAFRRATGFNPKAYMEQLGIQADLREYRTSDRAF